MGIVGLPNPKDSLSRAVIIWTMKYIIIIRNAQNHPNLYQTNNIFSHSIGGSQSDLSLFFLLQWAKMCSMPNQLPMLPIKHMFFLLVRLHL